MNITIVGAGNVATHLALALRQKNYTISAIYSRTAASAQTLAKTIGAIATTNLDQLPDTPIYIYCLKDDALPTVVSQVTSLHSQSLHLHTSGSIGLEIFPNACKRCGVLYPLQTFSKQRPVDFAHIPCFVEGRDVQSQQEIKALAKSISSDVNILNSEGRRALHLAAVFACNFVNRCYAIGEYVLREKAGVAFEKLLPLIDETATKVHHLSPREAQTGPAIRYDRRVIEAHLGMLAFKPLWQALYRNLTDDIHNDKLRP